MSARFISNTMFGFCNRPHALGERANQAVAGAGKAGLQTDIAYKTRTSVLVYIHSPADSEGDHVESQLVPVSEATKKLQKLMHEAGSLPSLNHAAGDELVFGGELPALGYATFFMGHSSNKVRFGVAVWAVYYASQGGGGGYLLCFSGASF